MIKEKAGSKIPPTHTPMSGQPHQLANELQFPFWTYAIESKIMENYEKRPLRSRGL